MQSNSLNEELKKKLLSIFGSDVWYIVFDQLNMEIVFNFVG